MKISENQLQKIMVILHDVTQASQFINSNDYSLKLSVSQEGVLNLYNEILDQQDTTLVEIKKKISKRKS